MSLVALPPDLALLSLLFGVLTAGYWYAIVAAEWAGIGPRNESGHPDDFD